MKKKLLMIDIRPPWPLVTGIKIRVHNTAKHLSKDYDVDLVTFYETEEELKQLQKTFNRVYGIKYSKIHSIINGLLGVFSSKPMQVKYFYSGKMQKLVNNIYQNYDAVFCQTIRTAEYVKGKDIPKVIDLHDAVSMNYQRGYEVAKDHWKLIYWLETPRVLKYEKSVIRDFDRAFIVSEVDKNYLLKRGAEDKISIIPVAIRDDIEPDKNVTHDQNTIVFYGKMDYRPNHEAAMYFIKKVLPKLDKKFKFTVVGIKPRKELLDLQNSRVKVTGFVDDPYVYVKKARFIVAPIISGSGVQNKVIEPMYLKKCVITTPLGAEGIDAKHGQDYLVAKNPSEFAKIINETNNKTISQIGENAHNFVKHRFTWKSIYKKFKKDIDTSIKDEQE